jgi:hypothetical protein
MAAQAEFAANLPGGAVRQRSVLEVADGEFDHGVLAVLNVQVDGGAGSVGHERMVSPHGEEGFGRVEDDGAPHDETGPVVEFGFGELGDPAVGVSPIGTHWCSSIPAIAARMTVFGGP